MKKLTCILVLACFLVSLSGTALAWSDRSEGRPQQIASLSVPSLSIWHDHDGKFFLKSINLRGKHVFTGVIKTDGSFYNINDKNLENGDFIRVDRARNVIRFRLTGRGFDEFSFRVKNGHVLKFDLQKNGRAMPSREIYIGKKGWHPDDNTFTLK